jgi:glycerol-3-phosphate dehydrogenase
LPGGDFAVDGVDALNSALKADYPFLTDFWSRRLVRAYGTEAKAVLGDVRSAADLGIEFGATLTEREVMWLMKHEFARSAEDIVWRRNKLGLRMSEAEIAALDDWMQKRSLSEGMRLNENLRRTS